MLRLCQLVLFLRFFLIQPGQLFLVFRTPMRRRLPSFEKILEDPATHWNTWKLAVLVY